MKSDSMDQGIEMAEKIGFDPLIKDQPGPWYAAPRTALDLGSPGAFGAVPEQGGVPPQRDLQKFTEVSA